MNFHSSGPKLAALPPPLHGLSMTNQKLVLLYGLGISLQPNKRVNGRLCSTSDTCGEELFVSDLIFLHSYGFRLDFFCVPNQLLQTQKNLLKTLNLQLK